MRLISSQRPLALLVSALLALTTVVTGATASQAAYSDLYSVRFKAWIPQAQTIGTAVGMTPDSFCSAWPASTVRFNGNGYRNFVNGTNGDFKTMVRYDFRWDGTRMSDVDVAASYGITHMTMTNSVTGSQCSLSKRAFGSSRVESNGSASAKVVLDSADPFYPAALIPNLNGEITLSFNGRDRLLVDAVTDQFPSYAYEVYRNGVLAATVQVVDGHCVNLTGPGGVLSTAQMLTLHYNNPIPRQQIDTRAAGQTFFQPCDVKYSVPPLKFPAITSTPVPPPTNLVPTAAFGYKRLTGSGNVVALNGRSSSDPDGWIRTWQWYLGSTLIATGPAPTVSLGAGTSKQVKLTVTDNSGGSATVIKTLTLANRGPRIHQTTPAPNAVAGTNTPRLAAVATDDDGDPLQYSYRVTGYRVDISSGWVPGAWDVPAQKLDPGASYTWKVIVRDPAGASSAASSTFTVAPLPAAADVVSTASGDGYWQVASDGGVFSYGDAHFYGSVPGLGLRVTNIMGMTRTPSGKGYWLVGRDGGVFSFGDAAFHGSLPGKVSVSNIVGMISTKSGNGYWLVGNDGGVFSFGDAPFHGSMGGQHLNAPVAAIATTPSGGGYYLVAADGGVFAFGDAPFYGSMGGQHLNAPVVDMDVTPDGGGYWLAAEDGGIFTFGNAPFLGSMGGKPLNGHVTGMAATVSGQGYWMNACDGGIFTFGDAKFLGANPTYQCRGVG